MVKSPMVSAVSDQTGTAELTRREWRRVTRISSLDLTAIPARVQRLVIGPLFLEHPIRARQTTNGGVSRTHPSTEVVSSRLAFE